MSIESRVTELRRFLPDRAVAAVLGVDQSELAGYREDPSDAIEEGEFRDPRFATMFAGGEYEVRGDSDLGFGSGYVPIYTLDPTNFAQSLGPADEYLLEVYADGDWQTTDEGDDLDNPYALYLTMYYDSERLPAYELQAGGLDPFPIESDNLTSSQSSREPDPDGFRGWLLSAGGNQFFGDSIPHRAGVRPWGAPSSWVVNSIGPVQLGARLLGAQGEDLTDGIAILRNTTIGVRLSTQTSLSG